MKSLPNSCKYSDLNVFPPNWNTQKASLKKLWRIEYRFYDPAYRHLYPNGYPKVIKKGISSYTNLVERQIFIQERIKEEEDRLTTGYNPILEALQSKAPISKVNSSVDIKEATSALLSLASLSPNTELNRALEIGRNSIKKEPQTNLDIKSVVKYTCIAAEMIGFHILPVSEVDSRVILLILNQVGILKGPTWTPRNYNYYRTYLQMVFKFLKKYKAIAHNPIDDIDRETELVKKRLIITEEERAVVSCNLKVTNYVFWRFLNIFFHSGSRGTEILRVKGKDVDLLNRRVLYLIKKGKKWREEYRAITKSAFKYWEEVMKTCGPEQYVFSRGLRPGDDIIRRSQLTRRWRTHVKKKLGIKADFYSLKHANTDEICRLLGIKAAADQNASTETITKKRYALGEDGRLLDKIREMDNELAPETEVNKLQVKEVA